MLEKAMAQENIRAIAVLFAVASLLGCSSDGVLKNPDSIKVTTLADMHGRSGHQGAIHIGPNNQHPEDAGMVKQVVLAIQDSEMSPHTLYLTVSTTSISLGRMLDHLREAVNVSIVPDLPESATPWTRMVWTFGGAGGDRFIGCLRVVTSTETIWFPLRGTTTEAWRAQILQEINKPPKTLDTQPAQVVSIGYYADEQFTEPLTDTAYIGDTIYTKVVFSKAVSVVIADDDTARPHFSSVVEDRASSFTPLKEFQYRMVPPGSALMSGSAQPYQDTNHIFICAYAVQGKDFTGVFRSHVNYGATSGSALHVKYFQYTGELPAEVGETITTWSPTDFVGQVYTQRDSEVRIEVVDGVAVVKGGVGARERSEPVAGVTITIMAGSRAGEQSLTDRNGRYLFPNVAEDTLHLRAERRHFEPKEVLVYRSRSTALANGDVPNFSGDPQRTPGNILLGQVWPDEVRPILAETLVVYDLLYVEIERPRQKVLGAYANGVVFIAASNILIASEASSENSIDALEVHAHEIAHAHQHAVAFVDGNDTGSWEDIWLDSPEGKAYAIARERDLSGEMGATYYDNDPRYKVNLLESAAETFAFYWYDRWGGKPLPRTPLQVGKSMKEIAPNRYRWIEEWLIQK